MQEEQEEHGIAGKFLLAQPGGTLRNTVPPTFIPLPPATGKPSSVISAGEDPPSTFYSATTDEDFEAEVLPLAWCHRLQCVYHVWEVQTDRKLCSLTTSRLHATWRPRWLDIPRFW